jgi:hypothetical protein
VSAELALQTSQPASRPLCLLEPPQTDLNDIVLLLRLAEILPRPEERRVAEGLDDLRSDHASGRGEDQTLPGRGRTERR